MMESVKGFTAGGLAGCCGKTIVAPLSRVTILMQVQSMQSTGQKRLGFIATVRKILRRDGFKALWRGNGAMLVHRFPYTGFTFLITDLCKDVLQRSGTGPLSFVQPQFHSLLSAGVGAAVGICFAYPLDVVRTRLSAQTNELHYKGIADGLMKIWRQEGVPGLYRGLVPSLSGAVPTVALNFAFYDITLEFITDPDQPSTFSTLLAGGFAGAASSAVMFPVDLVRRQLQLVGLHGQPPIYSGFFDATCQIFRKGCMQQGWQYSSFGGVREFYRGLLPEVCKVTPNIAVMFTVREWLMGWYWPGEEKYFPQPSGSLTRRPSR